MDDASWDVPSWDLAVRKSRSFLPETLEEAAELAALIEMAIDRETGRGVSELAVTIEGEDITLAGRCESFYHKQLAQHAAMIISGNRQLTNGIEVR